MTFLYYFLAILGISVLAIIHEGGHYLAARASGMRVLKYSIGFGPVLFKFKPKNSETTFQLGLIPFLAYVQIAGMSPNEKFDPDDPGLFQNKGWFARAFTIFAGPLANYFTASILVFGLALHGWPQQKTSPVQIDKVQEGSPAAEAGLLSGDTILEANGEKIEKFEDLIRVTQDRADKPTKYVVTREGQEQLSLMVTPELKDGRGLIGVSPVIRTENVPLGIGDALVQSVVFPYRFTKFQLEHLTKISLDDVAGPVGMGKMVAQKASEGPAQYIFILMMISVVLGFFNLLPFPALDGGRLVFLFYEMVTRRRPNEKVEAYVHAAGIVILLSIMVVVTFKDIFS